MDLKPQRRIAAGILKCGINRVVFEPARIKEIKEALTKTDIRSLINERAIYKAQKKGISSARSKKIKLQKKKGLRIGEGSRKGSPYTRIPRKRRWINRIRLQRNFLKELKDKKMIESKDFHIIYRKIKGGFFRNKSHLKLYLNENSIIKVKK